MLVRGITAITTLRILETIPSGARCPSAYSRLSAPSNPKQSLSNPAGPPCRAKPRRRLTHSRRTGPIGATKCRGPCLPL